MEKAPALTSAQDHVAARRVLRAGRIRPDRLGQEVPVSARGAGGRRAASLWLLAIAGVSAMATGGTLWALSAFWLRPQASPSPTLIASTPQALAPMPVIAPAPLPAILDLPSPPSPTEGTVPGGETPAIPLETAPPQEPIQIQIGRTHLRVRPIGIQDGEHPGSVPWIGLQVVNLAGGNLDIQRGDTVLGSCAGGPLSSLAAVTHSLRLEHDCILRLRHGAIHMVLLEDAPRDD